MRRQHRKDGYQFLSGLSLGNTGLIVAVAGILLTLFLMSNILPLVDEPENQEYCDMVRILYDVDKRGSFSRPPANAASGTAPAHTWVNYRQHSPYQHDNVLIPAPGDTPPRPIDLPARGLVYEIDGISVSTYHHRIGIKDNIAELLNPASRKLVAEKPLFVWLRESLGKESAAFDCKAINTPAMLAMLISSAIGIDGADAVEVFDLTAADALLLKRIYADRIRLELLFQDLDLPDDGLVVVRIDSDRARSLRMAEELIAAHPGSGTK